MRNGKMRAKNFAMNGRKWVGLFELLAEKRNWSVSNLDFAKWPHGSFASWCRRYGINTNSLYSDYNWNLELMKPAYERLTAPWEELMDCLRPEADNLATEITGLIQRISGTLRGQLSKCQVSWCSQWAKPFPMAEQKGLTAVSRNGILGGFEFREKILIDEFRLTCQGVIEESKYVPTLNMRASWIVNHKTFRILRANMLTIERNKTSLIAELMLPVYRSMIAEGGMSQYYAHIL